jgi:monoamine oxidase
LEHALSFMRNVVPLDPAEASALGGANGWRFASQEGWWVSDGFDTLVDALARPLGDSIRTGVPVVELSWSAEGVSATTAAGETHTAAVAIVSLPVGVLRAGAIEFDPALPDWKQEAIEGLRGGDLIRVIAECRTAFWEERYGPISVFFNLDSPWSAFGAPYADRPDVPPTLMAFLGGERATAVTGDPERVEQMFREALATMFPEVDVAGQIVTVEIVDWGSDPWARGGLSGTTVGGDGLRAQLGIPTPPLFWAGEAVIPGVNAGTLHAAFGSGRNAAIEALHLLSPAFVNRPGHLTWSFDSPEARQAWMQHRSAKWAIEVVGDQN